MSDPTIGGFFSGGTGGKSWSWKDRPIGTTIEGTIISVQPPNQQTDPATGAPQFKKNGEPKLVVRIDLQTAERDPIEPDDDGVRSLYVQGWMQGAVGDALRQHKVTEPQPGATLSVTLTERTPNENKMFSPINKFTAAYTPGPVTGSYFSGDQEPNIPPPTLRLQLVKPEAISDAAWAAMDDATRTTVANTMSASASQPPF